MARAKKHDSAEDSLSKRKAKKRSAKVSKETTEANPEDSMGQGVALCQEERWREALALFLKMRNKARKDGKTDLVGTLNTALLKVEYSVRRQMAAALTKGAQELLAKEYLLDVGQ